MIDLYGFRHHSAAWKRLYGRRQKPLSGPVIVHLVRETENRHDKNAILVWLCTEFVCYLPKGAARVGALSRPDLRCP